MGNEDARYVLVRIKWTLRRPLETKTETSGRLIIDFFSMEQQHLKKLHLRNVCKVTIEWL